MAAYVDRGLAMLRPEVTQHATAADALVHWAMLEGLPVIPTSANVTIYSPAGAELVASTAATIDASKPGRITFSRAWSVDPFELGEDYAALWTFVVAGVTYSERVFFDVVKNKLPVLVAPSDMLALQPNLAEHLRALGLPGTDLDLRRFALAGHVHLCNRLRKAGVRPTLIADRRRLAEPALHYALAYANQAMARNPDDLFDKRASSAWKLASEVFDGLGELKQDRDEDGTTAATETILTPSQPNWRT